MNYQLKKLMSHALTIRKRDRNNYGDMSEVGSFSANGFVEYGRRITLDRDGEEVLSTATIFLEGSTPIDPEWDYWIIDQIAPYVRKGMEVIQIDPIDDPRTGKTHHYEVLVR